MRQDLRDILERVSRSEAHKRQNIPQILALDFGEKNKYKNRRANFRWRFFRRTAKANADHSPRGEARI